MGATGFTGGRGSTLCGRRFGTGCCVEGWAGTAGRAGGVAAARRGALCRARGCGADLRDSGLRPSRPSGSANVGAARSGRARCAASGEPGSRASSRTTPAAATTTPTRAKTVSPRPSHRLAGACQPGAEGESLPAPGSARKSSCWRPAVWSPAAGHSLGWCPSASSGSSKISKCWLRNMGSTSCVARAPRFPAGERLALCDAGGHGGTSGAAGGTTKMPLCSIAGAKGSAPSRLPFVAASTAAQDAPHH